MSYQQVSLELVRDGQCTPWGFRMTGGADIGTPLVIQKVNFGSPSDGELQKGDIILRIRDADASRLSHQGATDLITKAGSTLKLVIARSVSGANISMSPVSTPHTATIPSGGNPFLYKPLPTTNFSAQRQRRSSVESYTSTTSSDTEKEAIINQPYRSIPLILPGAKITKDIPVGSYLRFDPLCRSSTSSPSSFDSRDPFMLTKVQHAILEAAQSSSGTSSPGRTPTPDMMNQNGPPMFLKQYNSPINMYSNQAIVEALAVQTVNSRKPMLNNVEMMENKKLTNIKESPTYQLIHDEEWKKGKVEEHAPLEEHVYNVIPRDGGDYYRQEIHQSESFKSIMQNFRGISDM